MYEIVGDHILETVGPAWYLILLCVANLLLSRVSYQKKALSYSGALAALFVGISVFWFVGFSGWVILITFFVTSTLLSKICRPYAEEMALVTIQKKGGCRDYMQVFANGGPAAISAILYGFTGDHTFLVLFGAAVAEATSDTWAGEIGILSSQDPVLISTFQEVQRGLSGGVTIVGTVGGGLGSLLIAITWYAFYSQTAGDFDWSTDMICILIAGFTGCLIDSVLGATLQGHYYDESTDSLTEHEMKGDVKLPLARGIAFVDNDVVNLLSNIYSTAIAYLLLVLI